MENAQTQSLLEVLAMAIFADKRILASEITSFVKAVKYLQAQKVIKDQLTETRIILWYETHKERLQEILTTHEFENWLHTLSVSLEHIQDPRPIFNAVKLISEADGEYHISEKAYAVLIQEHLAA